MKTVLIAIAMVLFVAVPARAQSPAEQSPKPVTVTMPAEDSAQLKAIQAMATKLMSDNAQVISAYNEYDRQLERVRSAAALLITRAALKAKLTIEQLDASELGLNAEGNYEWRPKPKANQ
jgi:hypothetical protein